MINIYTSIITNTLFDGGVVTGGSGCGAETGAAGGGGAETSGSGGGFVTSLGGNTAA